MQAGLSRLYGQCVPGCRAVSRSQAEVLSRRRVRAAEERLQRTAFVWRAAPAALDGMDGALMAEPAATLCPPVSAAERVVLTLL